MIIKRVAVLTALALCSITYAHAASIEIGQAFGGTLQPYVDALVQGVIAVLVGLALAMATKYLGWKADDSARDALTSFLQRQAHSLVADGVVKLNGVKIDVSNQALASAANLALTAVPDAMQRFGLTPDRVQAMIVDFLPKVQSVAAAQAVALDVANPATPSRPSVTAPPAV